MRNKAFLINFISILFIVFCTGCTGSFNKYTKNTDVKPLSRKKPDLERTGGVHMVIECIPPRDRSLTSGEIAETMKIMQNRFTPHSSSNIFIQRKGSLISIDIPGAKDPDGIRKTTVQIAKMQFVHSGYQALENGSRIPKDILERKCPKHYGSAIQCVVMEGTLKKAQSDSDADGRPALSFKLTDEGGRIFYKHTITHVNQYVSIAIDGKVLSSPVIHSAIYDGSGQITGSFTREEIQNLVTVLNSGTLPVPVIIKEFRVV